MRFLFAVAPVLSISLVQGCATRFEDDLPVHDGSVNDVQRGGVTAFYVSDYKNQCKEEDPHQSYWNKKVDSHWTALDQYATQGLSNSGFAVVDKGSPHDMSLRGYCRKDVGYEYPDVLTPENFSLMSMFMGIPYMFGGGNIETETL